MTTSAMSIRDESSSPVSGTWTITTTSGYSTTGHLPAWADDNPSENGISLDRLPVILADICHQATFDGQHVPVWNPASGHENTRTEEVPVLWGTIDCRPYSRDSNERVPVVNIAILHDYWITNLDPDGVTNLAALLRAQADRLDHDIRPRLVAARADWAEHHRDDPGSVMSVSRSGVVIPEQEVTARVGDTPGRTELAGVSAQPGGARR